MPATHLGTKFIKKNKLLFLYIFTTKINPIANFSVKQRCSYYYAIHQKTKMYFLIFSKPCMSVINKKMLDSKKYTNIKFLKQS